MEAPYTVASLPAPFDRQQGKVYSAPVHSLRGSKKRKRHEVAVAVDGEAVNIYNIRSQILTTSYALPPQTYSCCHPISIYGRGASAATPRRKTYLITRDGVSGAKRRLLCFTENVEVRKTDSAFRAPTKTHHDLKRRDILSLHVVPSGSDDGHSVLVSYRNGGIEIIDAELSKTHDEPPSTLSDCEKLEVESVDVITLEDALKGILRGRRDIAAQLRVTNAGRTPNLLCRLVNTKDERVLQMYSLYDPSQSSIRTPRQALHLIMTYPLPAKTHWAGNAARYELHAASGTLYQLLRGRLNVFDLTGTVPRLAIRLGSNAAPIDSFLRISSSFVLTVSNDTLSLSEVTFGAVQALAALTAPSASAVTSRKRKRNERDAAASSFDITCSFADTGLIFGISGQELLAVPVNAVQLPTKTGTLLRDVNATSDIHGTHVQQNNESKIQKWHEWTAIIDALVAADNIEALERFVADEDQLIRQRRTSGKLEDIPSDPADGSTMSHEGPSPSPKMSTSRALEPRKALYLLSKVFRLSGKEQGAIEVQIPSYDLMERLALAGVLSAPYLRRAFASTDKIFSAHILPGDIMTSISPVDDDFQLMRDLLSLPADWEAGEVVQALRLVIQSFDSPSQQGGLMAIDAPPQVNGDVEMTNSDTDSDIELESKALENELDLVMDRLDTGLEARSNTLHIITQRLGNFPQKVITSLMRSMLSSHEIVFFIHILRIELADGGWTSRYVDVPEEDEEEQNGLVPSLGSEEEAGPNDQAINAIGDLLNCAIDAIGTSGWLVGLSSSALGTDELITSLQTEVGAGLEGCYEAKTLGTFLNEMEVRVKLMKKTRVVRNPFDTEGGEAVDIDMSLLPLDSKGGQPFERERAEKTARCAVAKEKRRKIEKYALEQIRI